MIVSPNIAELARIKPIQAELFPVSDETTAQYEFENLQSQCLESLHELSYAMRVPVSTSDWVSRQVYSGLRIIYKHRIHPCHRPLHGRKAKSSVPFSRSPIFLNILLLKGSQITLQGSGIGWLYYISISRV
jgi:hypothetical protein